MLMAWRQYVEKNDEIEEDIELIGLGSLVDLPPLPLGCWAHSGCICHSSCDNFSDLANA